MKPCEAHVSLIYGCLCEWMHTGCTLLFPQRFLLSLEQCSLLYSKYSKFTVVKTNLLSVQNCKNSKSTCVYFFTHGHQTEWLYESWPRFSSCIGSNCLLVFFSDIVRGIAGRCEGWDQGSLHSFNKIYDAQSSWNHLYHEIFDDLIVSVEGAQVCFDL